MRAEQRRYVDMMAMSAFSAMLASRDPVGVIRATIEDALADHSKAIEAAMRRTLAQPARSWFERKGALAIKQAAPAFSLSAGTIVNYSDGFGVAQEDDGMEEIDDDSDDDSLVALP